MSRERLAALPLLPTTVVGSYPQPEWLVDREVLLASGVPRVNLPSLWRVPPALREAAQDDAVRLVVRDMERAGIDIVSDGEVRRESYFNWLAPHLGGIDLERPGTALGRTGRPTKVPRVIGPITRLRPVLARHTAFLRAETDRPIKVTVPGPFTLTSLAQNEHYPDAPSLALAFAAAVNAELRDLEAAGVDLIQLDEPYLQAWPDRAREYGVAVIDRALEGITTPTVIHLCFGYAHAVRDKPSGYSFLPELERCRATHVSIEAAQPRLDCAVLATLPSKTIVLGVLDLGDPAVETAEVVAGRIRQALAHVPPRAARPGARLRHEVPAARPRARQAPGAGRGRAPGARRARARLTASDRAGIDASIGIDERGCVMTATPRIGVIGLGNMGGGIARRLVAGGYVVTGYDIDATRAARAAGEGVKTAASPAAVASASDLVFSSVPDPAAIRRAYLGPDGVLSAARAGMTLIDISTIDPDTWREVAAAAKSRSVDCLDAPVSGGPADAASGKLVFMIGGEAAVLERCRPVLMALASGINHIGPLGSGYIIKLVNNVMSVANVVVAAEAMVLGVKAGLDPDRLFEVLSTSGGRSHHFLKRFPNVLAGDFTPNFSIDLSRKDIGLALGMAASLGMPMPVASAVQQAYETARAEGLGGRDMAAVTELYERWTGVKVRGKDAGGAAKPGGGAR